MLTAPPISKDLITYLEKVFPTAFIAAHTDANPHEIAAMVHREVGTQIVIRHLKAVHENQQTEDPLNVHEDPQAP
jgi:hypothetical protein